MRNNRRSLLEVHGVSHSVLQKHPHPDAEYSGWNDSELSPRSVSAFSKSPLATNFETISRDDNFSKRTPSLQTVFSYQTESSCSWSEENDKESTERVKKKLQESDDILYYNLENASVDEDDDWKRKFTYLRVVGKHITPTVEESIQNLQIGARFEENLLQNEENDCFEEIIAQDGIYEETASDDNTTCSSDTSQEYSVQVQEIKEKVLEKLTDHLMSKVAKWIAALGENRRKPAIPRIHSSVTRLPPLTSNSSPLRRSPISRPLTSLQQKRRRPVLSDKPLGPEKYLQGLLTISSKVLQNRSQSKPNDEWYKEILTTPQNLKTIPDKHSASSGQSVSTIRDDRSNIWDLHVPVQHTDEVENNASLPNIHRKSSPSQQAPRYAKTRSVITHPSPPLYRSRVATTSKNLPPLTHDSSASRQATKRIASALPTKWKGGRQSPANPRLSNAGDHLKDVHLHVPSLLQDNENAGQHFMLSPFALLPIVKSLTPLSSISRPKSKLEARKTSAPLQN